MINENEIHNVNSNSKQLTKKQAFELLKSKKFNESQILIKAYKENKLQTLFRSTITTLIPVGLAYGLYYERWIRKIPFVYQIIFIGLIFNINKSISIKYLVD